MEVNRQSAVEIFKEFNKSKSLLNHALAVEAVMSHAARQRGYDPEFWGIVGLLHDIDYELYPEEHCSKAAELLRDRGWPEDIIHAVVCHGWGVCSDVEPKHEMEKVLYAIDELTGLITATVLVRPSKSIMDLKVKSVRKKWKDKRFSAGVDRSIIEKGAVLVGIEISDLIVMTIEGMKTVATELGLAGENI